jgi:hypothetical protein
MILVMIIVNYNQQHKIYGTGQGSCTIYAIWSIVSSFLMDMLERDFTGMTIENIIQKTKINKQCIEGFVDDNSLFTNLKFGDEDIQKLLKLATIDGQRGDFFLNTSGGELELDKCFWYLLT